jgi:hypothetical protein
VKEEEEGWKRVLHKMLSLPILQLKIEEVEWTCFCFLGFSFIFLSFILILPFCEMRVILWNFVLYIYVLWFVCSFYACMSLLNDNALIYLICYILFDLFELNIIFLYSRHYKLIIVFILLNMTYFIYLRIDIIIFILCNKCMKKEEA